LPGLTSGPGGTQEKFHTKIQGGVGEIQGERLKQGRKMHYSL